MLRKTIYPKIESTLNQIASMLQKQGFTPNQLTLAGLAVNFVAGWIYAGGHLFWGGVFVLLAAFGDMLDGPLARISGKVTKFGAFLDSTIDRYSDFFIFGGLALHYARQGQGGLLLLCLGTIAGAFVTSYSKARAENLIDKCDAGVFERAERVGLFVIASIFWPLMPLALWVLFLGTNATAIQRILFTRKKLSE
jgi:CDP-diacylglycerol---glycerol-3-phosphate 3-phosphatidyltransferase